MSYRIVSVSSSYSSLPAAHGAGADEADTSSAADARVVAADRYREAWTTRVARLVAVPTVAEARVCHGRRHEVDVVVDELAPLHQHVAERVVGRHSRRRQHAHRHRPSARQTHAVVQPASRPACIHNTNNNNKVLPSGGETICPRRWQFDGGISFRRQSDHLRQSMDPKIAGRIYVRPRTGPQSAYIWWPAVAKLQAASAPIAMGQAGGYAPPRAGNNNDNSHDNVYGGVIMTKVIARVRPVHLKNAD